jgi:Na+/proline symporter
MLNPPGPVEYVVIGAYLLMLLGVGFAMRKMSSDVSDYFRAGAKGTWYLVGSSAFMAAFSAWTFTGAAGVAYEAGWSVIIIYASNAAGFF